MEDVPVGRNKIKFSYLGYAEQTIDNVIVSTGTEAILNGMMNEIVNEMEEVVVTAFKPGETRNEMATVSARPFTIEETERYAGSRADPARMASNFAGGGGHSFALKNDGTAIFFEAFNGAIGCFHI